MIEKILLVVLIWAILGAIVSLVIGKCIGDMSENE